MEHVEFGRTGRGGSHAKAILSGEHAVVYGLPAIAFPVHSLRLQATATIGGDSWVLSTPYHTAVVRRTHQHQQGMVRVLAETALTNTLDYLGSAPRGISVNVTGEIPPARGLGSSAAVAAAIATAVASAHGVTLTVDDHFELVQSVERVAHGTPSGLDARATIATGPIWFQAGQATSQKVLGHPRLIVADTGMRGHTVEAVSHVRRRREQDPAGIDRVLDEIGNLTAQTGEALAMGDHERVGRLMQRNHDELATLGVSHPVLDRLVTTALDGGALGAKLTGGGMGGCIIALVGEDKESDLVNALREAGAESVWEVNGTSQGGSP